MELSNLEDCKIINERLASLYGMHTVVDKPNFRLVFAPEQLEKRFGIFDVFVGDLFIREEGPMFKEVQKYAYLGDQWIVERLIGNHHKDVMEGDYVYEPIYAFEPNIFPSWKAVEFLIAHLFGRVKGQGDPENRIPKSQVEAEYREAKRIEKEKLATREVLDDVCVSEMGIALRGGEAVSFAGIKEKEKKNDIDDSVNSTL